MREVVNAVQRHRTEGNGHRSELDGWYSDLYDHVLRASEWTEPLRDMITTVLETNLSLQDARLNTVMKKLTGWAAIIAVPTSQLLDVIQEVERDFHLPAPRIGGRGAPRGVEAGVVFPVRTAGDSAQQRVVPLRILAFQVGHLDLDAPTEAFVLAFRYW